MFGRFLDIPASSSGLPASRNRIESVPLFSTMNRQRWYQSIPRTGLQDVYRIERCRPLPITIRHLMYPARTVERRFLQASRACVPHRHRATPLAHSGGNPLGDPQTTHPGRGQTTWSPLNSMLRGLRSRSDDDQDTALPQAGHNQECCGGGQNLQVDGVTRAQREGRRRPRWLSEQGAIKIPFGFEESVKGTPRCLQSLPARIAT